jgi:hypothetical protein
VNSHFLALVFLSSCSHQGSTQESGESAATLLADRITFFCCIQGTFDSITTDG